MFGKVWKVLTKVTKESCCYRYKASNESKMANEYWREVIPLHPSHNRNGISQIDPKIKDFVSLIFIGIHLVIENQLYEFL